MIRILVAEDQTLIRNALMALLSMEDDFEVVASAENGVDAVSLAIDYQPDIALLDIEMPRLNGLEAAQAIREKVLTCKTVIVTTFARPGYLQQAVKAGVKGYLVKDAEASELAQAIRTIHQGGKVFSPQLVVAAWEHENPLSERELSVLQAARSGMPTKELARHLGLSEGTIRNYLSEIMSKLDVPTRQAAVAKAVELGWI